MRNNKARSRVWFNLWKFLALLFINDKYFHLGFKESFHLGNRLCISHCISRNLHSAKTFLFGELFLCHLQNNSLFSPINLSVRVFEVYLEVHWISWSSFQWKPTALLVRYIYTRPFCYRNTLYYSFIFFKLL